MQAGQLTPEERSCSRTLEAERRGVAGWSSRTSLDAAHLEFCYLVRDAPAWSAASPRRDAPRTGPLGVRLTARQSAFKGEPRRCRPSSCAPRSGYLLERPWCTSPCCTGTTSTTAWWLPTTSALFLWAAAPGRGQEQTRDRALRPAVRRARSGAGRAATLEEIPPSRSSPAVPSDGAGMQATRSRQPRPGVRGPAAVGCRHAFLEGLLADFDRFGWRRPGQAAGSSARKSGVGRQRGRRAPALPISAPTRRREDRAAAWFRRPCPAQHHQKFPMPNWRPRAGRPGGPRCTGPMTPGRAGRAAASSTGTRRLVHIHDEYQAVRDLPRRGQVRKMHTSGATSEGGPHALASARRRPADQGKPAYVAAQQQVASPSRRSTPC